MPKWIIRLLVLLHKLLNKLLIRMINVNETNDVVKIVTKSFGLTWVDMENHIEVHNRFFIPYYLEEVKLTYYNDSNQNIGYLHYKGPVRIGAFQRKVVKMPAKMSNITALFNGFRMLLVDHIKTRTVGTTRIRLFGMSFELPIDDIMIVDKDKIVTEEIDEAEKQRRALEKAARAKEKLIRKTERKAKRKERRERLARESAERRQQLKERLNKSRKQRSGKNKKELPESDPKAPINHSDVQKDATIKQESSTPDPSRSYPDATT
ncbi:MAG: hypothetical protein GY751_05685 [Bacteroidetes bacterium]|nr:hypothetical protein [Bacteroidota bacterium]